MRLLYETNGDDSDLSLPRIGILTFRFWRCYNCAKYNTLKGGKISIAPQKLKQQYISLKVSFKGVGMMGKALGATFLITK